MGKCRHQKCKFRQEMLIEMKEEILEELENYLGLEDAESYITECVIPRMGEFKNELKAES